MTADGAWEPWLLYMLQGVAETYSRELAELIFERPYCRIAHVVESGLAKRQTASLYLKELVDIGILEEHKIGREKIFLNPTFIGLLKQD